MEEKDLREKYIQILMKKGTPRNIAEETVDLIDDDGNVVGLISENELIIELTLRDIFRDPIYIEDIILPIAEPFSDKPGKALNIEEALRRLLASSSASFLDKDETE